MGLGFEMSCKTAVFPETSPRRYVTGMAALNIPSPENTGGDWHFRGTFRSTSFPNNTSLAGEGLDWNTNALFGNYGIHECSDSLRCRGISLPEGTRVYSANHYRAILDMLARSVSKGQVHRHLTISDWLDTDEHRKTFSISSSIFPENFFFRERIGVFLDQVANMTPRQRIHADIMKSISALSTRQ